MKNFVVYKSGAGSGKTFTLVKEYLRLALYDDKKLSYNYKRILAVTFTNKAAAEMKTRVIEALNQISTGKTLPLIGSKLCEELNISEKELRNRASYLLGQILHHYSDLSIGTIDSFTHKIVKTFAHDLKLPVNFNIELDTEGFYEKVIAQLFNKIGEDEYVSNLLKEYALNKAQDNSGWDPAQQIQEFVKLLQKENSENYLEQLKHFSVSELETFRKQFIDFTRYYKSTLRTEAQKAIELIRNNHLSDDDFTYKKSGPQSFFRKCAGLSVSIEDISGARLRDAIEKNKWSGNTSAQSDANIKTITSQLNHIALILIDFIKENYNYFSLCELLSRQMYPLMLLKKIEEISAEQKQEERLVFISEFNQRIFEIINNEPAPFIYERLGERYRHYLLDEFQDTSSLQWHNILPLLDNSLSAGWFNLIVGDGKQSIYRWRNANVQQFASLPHIDNPQNNRMIEERADSLERNFLAKVLGSNFRSTKTIVEFNNSLFTALTNKLLVNESKTIYTDHAQKIESKHEGYVTVHSGKTEKDETDSYTCSLIKEHIDNAKAQGYEYKDICILCRTNKSGNVVANYLISQKIQIVSSDSLLLKNNFEINTLICYLSYLTNKEDTVSAAAVVNYLLRSKQIDESQFHHYLSELSRGTSLFEIFKKCSIDLSEEDISLNNLFDNCIEAIKALKLNKTGYHYLRFFLDEVNEFLVLKNSDISFFFKWWEARSNVASMIIPDSTNAVKIMTIHASKGLEFPVVIVPYCNWGIYRAGDSWVNVKNEKIKLPVAVVNLSKKASDSGFNAEYENEQKLQVLDNLNLLYVAFTRAIERLHIIGTSSQTNKKANVSDWINDFMQAHYKPVKVNFYEIGQPILKLTGERKLSLPAFGLAPLEFETNKNAIRIKASYLNNNENAEEAKEQGLLVHWLLSKIKTEIDIDRAIEAALLKGLLTQKEIPDLKRKLEEIIRHPLLKTFFEGGADIRLEAELVTPAGEVLRPDRVILSGKEATLLDYKTGKENNKSYFQQLNKYESALLAMGYTSVKKLLIYVDDMNVVNYIR
jgi:ATP-dependent exoDNAse (exonuclease V) beta subunit